jgi:tRNA A-37 threonylcarbamoyl transferase component Bud32
MPAKTTSEASEWPLAGQRYRLSAGVEPELDLTATFAAARSQGALVKDEPDTQIWKADIPGIGLSWWKEYRIPRSKRPLKLLSRSRSEREWAAIESMHRADLPVPRPILYAEWRRLGALTSSLVVTGDVPDTLDLESVLASSTIDETVKYQACRNLGRLAHEMHGKGFVHFRLVPRNILVEKNPGQRVWLLDTPYSCHWKAMPPRASRRYDLAQACCINGGMKSRYAEEVLAAYNSSAAVPFDTGRVIGASKRRRKIARIALHTLARVTGHTYSRSS